MDRHSFGRDRTNARAGGPKADGPGRRGAARIAAVTAALALVLVACTGSGSATSAPASVLTVGGSSSGVIPVIVNEELGVGQNHFVFTIVDGTNADVAAPDRTASVALTPAGSGSPAATADGEFVWGIQGTRGFYVTDVTFPTAGQWQATFTTAAAGSPATTSTVTFEVKDKTSAIAIGQHAPSTKTPTLADVGGDPRKISSDPNPDPRFYQASEDAALAAHKPFVLVFATPAFCTSAQCGPTLDHVKSIATKYPDITFINVEPYKLQYTDGKLQPVLDATNSLQATDVTDAWGILTEPWVYVVDKNGVVTGSFPSVFSDKELTAALDALK